MPQDDAKEARASDQLVAKANEMIQRSRYTLTNNENKALLYLISKIQPDDPPGKRYTFDFSEFRSLIGWADDAPYKQFRAILEHIDKLTWYVPVVDEYGRPTGKELRLRWLDHLEIDKNEVTATVSFHPDTEPYLFGLQARKVTARESGRDFYYTAYQLSNVLQMKCKYSPRLYELLRSYSNRKEWTWELGTGTEHDLFLRLADIDDDSRRSTVPKSWRKWNEFRTKVLVPACDEINMLTDIQVTFEGKKCDSRHPTATRGVSLVTFYIDSKTTIEMDRIEEDRREAYGRGEQLSIEDVFFAERRDAREAEAQAREQERIERSEHPLMADEFPEFTEEQLKALYTMSIARRVVGRVPQSKWEMFATDYVSHYKLIVDATPEATKSNSFARLLDMVQNDRQGVAEKFISIHGYTEGIR